MKYIVYLTTNLQEKSGELNRIYIGVHSTENPEIFDGYIGCGVYVNQPSTYKYPKTPFQYAVKKYGTDSFHRETLFIYDSAEQAYAKEKEIVDIDFLKQDHVYNVCLGGEYYNNYKKLYQFDLEGKLIKCWEYSKEAYDFYGYSRKRFEYAIHNKHEFLNSYWSRENQINVSDYYTSVKGKPTITYLYSKSGKLLEEFYSQRECSEFLGMTDVNKAIKNQSLVQNQYYISTKLVDKFIPKARNNYINKIYYVYDKTNKFYGKFKGKEVMPIIGLHSWSTIRDIFRYNKNWYKDFYISETEINQVPLKQYSNGIQIDVYDKFGNFIETLKSIKDVREKYKVTSSQMKNIQMGDKYLKDWIFKYHSK